MFYFIYENVYLIVAEQSQFQCHFRGFLCVDRKGRKVGQHFIVAL